jgi:hypothetical protein
LRANGTAVQRDFANRGFQEGDPVEKLLATHTPTFRVVGSDKVYLVFRPADSPEARGRTLIVLSERGKLTMAATSVELGLGERGLVSFLPNPRLEFSSVTDEWEELGMLDQRLNPLIAVTGCPAVVGVLQCAGWYG